MCCLCRFDNSVGQVSTAKAHQEKQVPLHLHGTVNIIIANKNGLVAVTDSRLSSDGRAAGEGQKLFRVDDHTICTIAGWYSSFGPTVDGRYFPAYASVPLLMSRFIRAAGPDLMRMSALDKSIKLAQTFEFGLNFFSSLNEEAGLPASMSPFELTLISSQGKTKLVIQTIFKPHRTNEGMRYEQEPTSVIEVREVMMFRLAGVSSVAEPILEHPERTTSQKSAILNYLKESVISDGGSSLTTQDMLQIARKLESMTASAYPQIVGGPVETGIIENDFAKVDQPYTDDGLGEILPKYFAEIRGGGVTGGGAAKIDSRDTAVFVHEFALKNCTQQLDQIFFFHTNFDNCKLTYNGTANFIFDNSNKVSNSVLTLSERVDPTSSAVRHIRREFPQLLMMQRGQPVP